ncbi:MAG: response regulator [Gaiellaceae bacterium]
MSEASLQPVGRTALIADDSVAVRRLVSARLRRDGYSIREAADGHAALEEVEREPPDVLIVDDVLPGLSGVEVVEGLRARGLGDSVRVALLIEYSSGLRRAALVGLPVSSVIRKPFDLDRFADRIERIAATG